MPTWWQNSTDDGSPPCSPQIPTLRSGRVLRPRSIAILTNWPTPSRSIERKRILLEDAFRQIGRQHFVDVVARETECGLREIVGAEGKELRFFRDLIRDQAGARQLDHRADEVINVSSLFFENFFGHAANDRCLVRHFFQRRDERNHDFGIDLYAIFGDGDGRFKNGARLHLGNFRISDSEPASAMSEHGIELVQLLHARQE